jgi:hypothetical protein
VHSQQPLLLLHALQAAANQPQMDNLKQTQALLMKQTMKMILLKYPDRNMKEMKLKLLTNQMKKRTKKQ